MKTNWLSITAIVLIVVLLVGGLGFLSEGFRNWKPSDWFKQDKDEDPELIADSGVTDENGKELVSGKVYTLASQMIFTFPTPQSQTAGDGITVNAVITPANATYKQVDWSVTWNDPNSSWANNKVVTDYVTITPVSNGSTTATISCLQSFGEQIIINVVSRDNANATATCAVDYAMRLDPLDPFFFWFSVLSEMGEVWEHGPSGYDFELPSNRNVRGFINDIDFDGVNEFSYVGTENLTLGFNEGENYNFVEDYTIADNYTLSLTIEINPAVYALLNSGSFTYDISQSADVDYIRPNIDFYLNFFDDRDLTFDNMLYLNTILKTCGITNPYTLVATAVGNYGTYTERYDFNMDFGIVGVDGVTIDPGTIIICSPVEDPGGGGSGWRRHSSG